MENIETIKKNLEKIARWPWTSYYYKNSDYYHIIHGGDPGETIATVDLVHKDSASFIAESPQTISELLTELESIRAENARLRDVLSKTLSHFEWLDNHGSLTREETPFLDMMREALGSNGVDKNPLSPELAYKIAFTEMILIAKEINEEMVYPKVQEWLKKWELLYDK